ncbi:stage V sporulation protein AE [Brevibacillus invocatus]|uniref:Stage V sporulation protein AE n=1 Tax=Brevibacillus invocatus TaxID=173959 RepID=A0A3M8CIK1_9BACL|nr:stage V sporulation protein AE [Brevibacillus invocatus]MCM3077960.1 stage V sporulation protein AE [Brevibacillus invocatus]MCM3427966.1 stage V sporulation protein AE [Brevibacillus invocatus]RNB75408.1 stage V sporulation protein AE [Brevibacillus invocatus]
MNGQPRKVIVVTDGDHIAQKAVEAVAKDLGGRCISLSAGNPTPLDGSQMVELIQMTPYDPVIVMFDDNGDFGRGRGERALEYVVKHPAIEVIGAIAVASNTRWVQGATVQYSIDKDGQIVEEAVDKDGYAEKKLQNKIYGDTVDVLNSLHIPNLIGIGDIGKMEGHDSLQDGCPITKKAVQWILERSGSHGGNNGKAASHRGTIGREQDLSQ